MPKFTFIWDAENLAHVARHGVSPAEAERVVNDPRFRHTTSNDRFHRPGVLGYTRGRRWIWVWYDLIDGSIRVTTAYDK